MELFVSAGVPVVVVILCALGIRGLMSSRGSTGKRGTAMTAIGFDVVHEALYPSKRHQIEQRDHEALLVEQDAEDAPPRTRIDLDGRTAHIHLP